MLTACATIVVGAGEPGTCFMAVARPCQGDAPPANTTPASEAGLSAAAISVHSPGVAAVQQRLQRCTVEWGRLARGADLGSRRFVVGGPADLTEDTHHGV